jgi:DNA-binding CsgD family transcriptional regulator
MTNEPNDLYRPLLERSLVNYQIQYLARNYDFGKESRVAALIVAEVNGRIEETERQLRITRVPPFHLYLKRGGQDLALPLFRPEYLEPILNRDGGFWTSRELMAAACGKVVEKAKAKFGAVELLGVVDPDYFVRHGQQRKRTKFLIESRRSEESPLSSALREQIEQIHPISPLDRVDALDTGAPVSLVNRLSQFVEKEAGRGPTVSNHLVQELITIRNVCCPRPRHLKSGEMPFLTTSVNAHLSEEVATRFRRLKPVILTVWTLEELKRCPWDNPISEEQLIERFVRVCFEAYRQGGLLSMMDLQWIFQISAGRISKLLRRAQRKHKIIVPTPGTILDSGRTMTHKDIVIELYLQVYTVQEIARMTYHSPRAVDNYIGTFESVLILDLYHVPKQLMSRILRKGVSLIEEYLCLARKHFRDEEDIKRLLAWKEVRF